MSKKDCLKIFEQLLKTCAIDIPSIKKVKAKRALTGYNCFTRNMYAAEKKQAEAEKREPMSYKKLISQKGWAILTEKQKEIWRGLAKQQCPIVTDPKNPNI